MMWLSSGMLSSGTLMNRPRRLDSSISHMAELKLGSPDTISPTGHVWGIP